MSQHQATPAPFRASPWRPVLAGVVAFAALLAVHGATWWIVSGRILDGVPSFVESAAREGWIVRAQQPVRTGWPWRAAVRAERLEIAGALGGAPMRYAADWIEVGILPAAWNTLRIAPGGAQRIELGGGAEALQAGLTAGRAELALPLDGSGDEVGTIRDLLVSLPDGMRVLVGVLDARSEPNGLHAEAGGIKVEPPLPSPLDGPARFEVRLTAAAGRVEVSELTAVWGALRLAGRGEGALDAEGQPAGRATLRVAGAAEVLETAVRTGLVQPGPAAAARGVLGVLSLASPGGDVTLPIVLAKRTLTVAQFALLRWPLLVPAPPRAPLP